MQASQADIGMAMTEAIHQSRCCQALRTVRGGGCYARFEFYVQCTQDELTRTFAAGPRLRLVQDIQDIRDVLHKLANYDGPSDDRFRAEVRPIVTAVQRLLRDARQHPSVAARLDESLANAESLPRSNAATASRSSSSRLTEIGTLTSLGTQSTVAGSGEWSTSEGDFRPLTLDIVSELSSEDTEDSGFMSQASDTTSTSEHLRMLKGWHSQ